MNFSKDIWSLSGIICIKHNESLVQGFSEEEVWKIIKDLPRKSAPGPEGFPTFFYKFFGVSLNIISWKWLEISLRGELELKRLNYGVITLIPKIKDANTIKQFRPICLINVTFKIITKLLAVRLGNVANKIINENQTAFIKERNILGGCCLYMRYYMN